ncbi:hypothetical protein [Flagellimonas pacifica]|uniref:Uncharacterized protein n=1 Tax=Flagellimonas pacifica TaxID=1247520 RepID=A0A285MCS6_9FLAO|nr:hypothetical protein [Allomuricauda parva]SNY94960.1 hypothetical protein SAMN06265377_0622 [Allomuricauda parva]
MKAYSFFRSLLFLTFFIGNYSSFGQFTEGSSNIVIMDDESLNLQSVFNKTIAEASSAGAVANSLCLPNEFVEQLDAFLKKQPSPIPYNLRHDYDYIIADDVVILLQPEYAKGAFNTPMDKVLSTFQNTSSYVDFVTQLTGTDLGGLTKREKYNVQRAYGVLKYMLDKKGSYPFAAKTSFKFENCLVSLTPAYKVAKYEYPSITYDLSIETSIECDCPEENGSTSVKNGAFEYRAQSKGIYSGTKISFGDPINPGIFTKTIKCCAERTETEKTARAESNKEDTHFIKDTRNIFLNPNAVNEYKNYVVTEWGKDKEEQNDPNAEGGFFREAGSFAYGVYLGNTVGKEKDFYGITYGAELGYYHNISDDFQIGATAGYSRYTGKETDFGFEAEGESFIPVMAKASYSFSDAFGAEAGLGYAISASEGGEGGLSYSAGPFWRPLEAIVIFVGYSNIAFGEGSLGAFILSGRFSLSKK